MHKIILLDDEEFVVRSLSNAVEWKKYDFELVGTFTNPLKALEFIKNNHVDAMFLDINMPVMSGIEFLEKLSKDGITIKTVLLSGYSDFEYMQKAVEYNAFLYILKPVNLAKVEEALGKINESLRKSHITTLQSDVINDIGLRKQFVELFCGKLNADQFYEFFLNHKFGSKRCCFAGITIEIQDIEAYLEHVFSHGIHRLYHAIGQIVSGGKLHYVLLNTNIDKMKLLVFYDAEPVYFIRTLFSECNALISNVLDLLNLNIDIYYDFVENDYHRLENMDYRNALEITNANAITRVITRQNEKEAYNLMRVMSKTFETMEAFSHEFITCILLQYLRSMKSNSLEGITPLMYALEKSFKTPQELYDYILKNRDLFDEFKDNDAKTDIISIIKKYVEKHYNEDISLEDVAELVSRNPSYLSRYFKNKTGEKYLDYFNGVRLNKAIELILNTDMKIRMIAEQVGYKDINYFYKVFKEKIGFSPQKLRDDKGAMREKEGKQE